MGQLPFCPLTLPARTPNLYLWAEPNLPQPALQSVHLKGPQLSFTCPDRAAQAQLIILGLRPTSTRNAVEVIEGHVQHDDNPPTFLAVGSNWVLFLAQIFMYFKL